MAVLCSEVGIFLDMRLSAKAENASIGYLSSPIVYRSFGWPLAGMDKRRQLADSGLSP